MYNPAARGDNFFSHEQRMLTAWSIALSCFMQVILHSLHHGFNAYIAEMLRTPLVGLMVLTRLCLLVAMAATVKAELDAWQFLVLQASLHVLVCATLSVETGTRSKSDSHLVNAATSRIKKLYRAATRRFHKGKKAPQWW